MSIGKLLVPVKVEGLHFHTEGFCSYGDFLAYSAQTHDSDGFAHDLVACETFPFSTSGYVGFLHQVANQSQKKGKSMFGNCRMVDPGAKSDGDSLCRGVLHIDLVYTYSVLGDHLESWKRFVYDARRD